MQVEKASHSLDSYKLKQCIAGSDQLLILMEKMGTSLPGFG